MAYKVILPKLGTNAERATVVSWLKKEGESVLKNEVLAEVSTDKATFEVEAEYSGILRKILCPVDSEIDITKTIAIIAEPGEDITEIEEQVKKEKADTAQQFAKQVWRIWFEGKAQPSVKLSEPNIRMSPAARELARTKNIDLETLTTHYRNKKETLEVKDIVNFIDSEKIVVYGAGLGLKQALEIIRNYYDIKIVGLIDDNPELKNKIICGYKVLGGFDDLAKAYKNQEFSGVALSFHSETRRKIFIKLKNEIPQIRIKTLIDSKAIVSPDAEIGDGVFIEAGTIIGPGVKIGDGSVIDLGAVVCHDCFIGEFSHLSPGCVLSGIVCLKENVLIGAGASVNSTVTIGKNVIITPGSAVMNDVQDKTIVNGIPAVVIGESRRGE
ncbi:MAG: NeuD/PglB/VioB family sugar acetyltransferase [Candidatus Omnitrophota bacterium]